MGFAVGPGEADDDPRDADVRLLHAKLGERDSAAEPQRDRARRLPHRQHHARRRRRHQGAGGARLGDVHAGRPARDAALMCVYRHPTFDLVHADAAWASPLIPSADDLAQRYSLASGQPLEHWEFYMALAYFKLAIIAAGIQFRDRQGGGTADGDKVGAAVAATARDWPERTRGPPSQLCSGARGDRVEQRASGPADSPTGRKACLSSSVTSAPKLRRVDHRAHDARVPDRRRARNPAPRSPSRCRSR